MTLIRPSTFIAKLKAVFGVVLSFIMLVSLVYPGAVKTTSKVTFETEKSITATAEEIKFTVTNNSPYAIDKHIGLSAFEKKVGDEWKACSKHLGYGYPPLKESFKESNILAGETWQGVIDFDVVFSEDGHGGSSMPTLEAGQYKITFSYKITGSSEVSFASCEFTVA